MVFEEKNSLKGMRRKPSWFFMTAFRFILILVKSKFLSGFTFFFFVTSSCLLYLFFNCSVVESFSSFEVAMLTIGLQIIFFCKICKFLNAAKVVNFQLCLGYNGGLTFA